jgi:hypothetical protein
MNRENAIVGMKVAFGRPNGEKTVGIIRKVNSAKAKVETVESRGIRSVAGAVWSVPYSMMEPFSGSNPESPAAPVSRSETRDGNEPFPYSPFLSGIERNAMLAINCAYNYLSPENLSCDGELPIGAVRKRAAEIERKLNALFAVIGRRVSEDAAYAWYAEYENSNKPINAD